MNMDMLSRVFDIVQRAGGMEQINQFMVIVYGALCIFGLMNCILGYRILRFWMMIFGFLIGAGGGFAATYISGVQDKMVIAGAMAGLGIVLAIISFLIYRAGIFVLGFGIGISLSIYLVHPTSSFSFFLCILIGVGLGTLAMRYAKGVIIIGTSVLGGVLAGFSLAKIGGLAQFPYGAGMAVGIALLGMLIQFTINKDHEEEDDEEEEDEPYEDTGRRTRGKNERKDQDYVSEHDRVDFRKNSPDRQRKNSGRNADSDVRYSRRNSERDKEHSDRRTHTESRRRSDRKEDRYSDNRRNKNARNTSSANRRSVSERNSSSSRRRSSAGRTYSSDTGRYQNRDSAGSDPYYDYDDIHQENQNTYEDFEKLQQRKRRMDIENMADYDDQKPVRDAEPDDYDEWEDN